MRETMCIEGRPRGCAPCDHRSAGAIGNPTRNILTTQPYLITSGAVFRYEKSGMIKLQVTMDLADPKHLYEGLLFEAINGLLENYVWLRHSRRHFLPVPG